MYSFVLRFLNWNAHMFLSCHWVLLAASYRRNWSDSFQPLSCFLRFLLYIFCLGEDEESRMSCDSSEESRSNDEDSRSSCKNLVIVPEALEIPGSRRISKSASSSSFEFKNSHKKVSRAKRTQVFIYLLIAIRNTWTLILLYAISKVLLGILLWSVPAVVISVNASNQCRVAAVATIFHDFSYSIG